MRVGSGDRSHQSLRRRPMGVVPPASRNRSRRSAHRRSAGPIPGIGRDSSRWVIPNRPPGSTLRHEPRRAARTRVPRPEPIGLTRMNRIRAALAANPLLVDAAIALGLTALSLFAFAAAPDLGPASALNLTLVLLQTCRSSFGVDIPWRSCSSSSARGATRSSLILPEGSELVQRGRRAARRALHRR